MSACAFWAIVVGTPAAITALALLVSTLLERHDNRRSAAMGDAKLTIFSATGIRLP